MSADDKVEDIDNRLRIAAEQAIALRTVVEDMPEIKVIVDLLLLELGIKFASHSMEE